MEPVGVSKAPMSDSSAELFKKEPLGNKDGSSERRGKQRRRERVSKGKIPSDKQAKIRGDVLAQIKAKENIVTSGTSSQRVSLSVTKDSLPTLFTKKIGIYNKGKTSLLVSRRRPLHAVQYSQKTLSETEQDVKRVLGHDYDKAQTEEKKVSPMTVGAQEATEQQRDNDMEVTSESCSPSVNGMDILDIAKRIAEGLHPQMVRPNSTYLTDLKAELRKLMKQQNSIQSSAQFIAEDSPEKMEKSNSPQGGIQQAPIAQHLLLPSSPSPQSKPFFSLPLFPSDGETVSMSGTKTSDFHLNIFPVASGEESSHLETNEPFDLVEVELGNADMDSANFFLGGEMNAAFVGEPLQSQLSRTTSGDFLDLLDNMHQDTSLEDPPSKIPPRAPGSKWMPTPERPPMFPQKLY